ncbi:MAG: nucleotide sugar dehydrogenase [Armatimonadetes bacterium]|nr:nucleotide sugar dehydrogenase [Armatimonadota bacterium]
MKSDALRVAAERADRGTPDSALALATTHRGSPVHRFKERIIARDLTVGIVGMGYVGLPLVLRFGGVGFRVLGFDVDPAKVDRLNAGSSYIQHVPTERVADMVSTGLFAATSDLQRLEEPDAIIICVPTPLTRHREPNLRYVEATADAVARALRPGQLVCLESTTYPGTTEEVVLPRLASGGLQVGDDFYLAYSPEREDPGNPSFHTAIIPKVVGGMTPACLEVACTLYSQAIERVVPVSSTGVAEATKLLENIYRSVNIALVNELKVAFDRMGIDIWEVIEAAKTKPFGFQAFYPGPGLGGHCIPIDPFYLTWKAREYGISTRFIELAGEVNTSMPAYVVQKVVEGLNLQAKPLRGSRVLVLGLAYKKDVDDPRESPSLVLMELLAAGGARVDYSDPYFPSIPPMRKYAFDLESVPLTPETLASYDAVVLATDHTAFPYELIHEHAALIIDTRNAFRSRHLRGEHVLPA